MEAVDSAKPDAQLARACSFGPQGWPWWDDEDLRDPATPVLLARDDHPGTGIRPELRGVQGIQSAKLPDAGRNRKKGRDGEAIPETVRRLPGQVSEVQEWTRLDIYRGGPLLEVHLLKGDEGGDGVERCKFPGKRGILQVRGA